MLRQIGAGLVGYIAMAVAVFVSFTVAYLAMGAGGAFQPGTYAVSALWVAVTILLGLLAALIGGLVCGAISRGGRAPKVLAVIVLVLGFSSAIPVLMDKSEPVAREGDVGYLEAMQSAKQPDLFALINPFIGAIGILIGASLRRGEQSTQESA